MLRLFPHQSFQSQRFGIEFLEKQNLRLIFFYNSLLFSRLGDNMLHSFVHAFLHQPRPDPCVWLKDQNRLEAFLSFPGISQLYSLGFLVFLRGQRSPCKPPIET